MFNYGTAPNNLGGSFKIYVEHKVSPGSFLTAVLSNDLRESCRTADEINRKILFDIIQWIYWELPSDCWGSEEKVMYWLEDKDTVNDT